MGAACTTTQRISNEPLPQVVAAIASNDPTKVRIDLSCRGLGLKGAQEVASAISNNCIVKSLFLGWNDVEDAGVQVLCSGLKDNWSLGTLILSGNQITDEGANHMADFLGRNCSLTYLSLSTNQITLAGATALLQSLESNSALRSLSLGGNCITSPTIDFVSDTLRRNVMLVSLELGGNSLPPECFDALQRWCQMRQKCSPNPRRLNEQNSFQALSQCANPSFSPPDGDLSNQFHWEDYRSEAEVWRVEGASMMAQFCVSEKPCTADLDADEFLGIGGSDHGGSFHGAPEDCPCQLLPGRASVGVEDCSCRAAPGQVSVGAEELSRNPSGVL
eukprot:GGOE01003137.1.p1 GENE.GGOE01003137.1~~GGOE01003137.1.p1  ORF type:complete len:332 (-),score=69.06 GGOE01003137.1:826-1821(-)